MKRSRVGVRGAALVILSAAAIGGAAGVAIHLLQSGGASGSHDNPPGLHGQATWRPGVRPAPDFSLTDQSGRPVSLASFRGGNVMLAFLSSRCRSACAREARYLRTALRLLPSAARPAMIIVSVDPRHDTPESTRAAVKRWRLDSAHELALAARHEVAAGAGVEVVPSGSSAPRREYTGGSRLPDRPGGVRASRPSVSVSAHLACGRPPNPRRWLTRRRTPAGARTPIVILRTGPESVRPSLGVEVADLTERNKADDLSTQARSWRSSGRTSVSGHGLDRGDRAAGAAVCRLRRERIRVVLERSIRQPVGELHRQVRRHRRRSVKGRTAPRPPGLARSSR